MEMVTDEQLESMMRILHQMGYTKQEVFQICHCTEHPEQMLRVLDVLEERDYEIPFKELLPIAQRIEKEVEDELPDEG